MTTENTAPVSAPVAAPAPAPAPAQSFSAEYVKELREENKTWRLKHEEAARTAAEAKAAADKAAAEATETITKAQQAINDRIIRAELKAVALAAGMVDLDGLKLADLSAVKLADDGSVEGAEELMTKLKEAKPYLFGDQKNSSPPITRPAPKPNEAKSATEMTKEEYAKAKRALGLRA